MTLTPNSRTSIKRKYSSFVNRQGVFTTHLISEIKHNYISKRWSGSSKKAGEQLAKAMSNSNSNKNAGVTTTTTSVNNNPNVNNNSDNNNLPLRNLTSGAPQSVDAVNSAASYQNPFTGNKSNNREKLRSTNDKAVEQFKRKAQEESVQQQRDTEIRKEQNDATTSYGLFHAAMANRFSCNNFSTKNDTQLLDLDVTDNFGVATIVENNLSSFEKLQAQANIPSPPPFPEILVQKVLPSSNINFKQEIFDKFNARSNRSEEINQKFVALENTIVSNRINAQKKATHFTIEIQDQVKDLLLEYEKLKNSAWSEKHETFLKKFRSFKSMHITDIFNDFCLIGRHLEEAYKLFSLNLTFSGREQLDFFLINSISERLFTVEDYKSRISLYNFAIDLLNKYPDMPESYLVELLRRSGVIYNNDAQHYFFYEKTGTKDAYITYILHKAGEGYTLDSSVYQKNSEHFDLDTPLTTDQKKEILQNFQNKKVYAQIFITEGNKFIESSEERHINYVLPYTKNNGEQGLIAVLMVTSTNDKGTFPILDKQYMNDEPHSIKKKQYLRILGHPIEFPIVENSSQEIMEKRFTELIHNENYNGVNIHSLVYEKLHRYLQENQEYSVRAPLFLDKAKMIEIARVAYEKHIREVTYVLENKLDNLENKPENLQQNQEKAWERQKRNFYERQKELAYRDSLSVELQKVLISEEQFEEKKRKHLFDKKKDDIETQRKMHEKNKNKND